MQRKRRKTFDVGFYLLVLLALVLSYYALSGVNRGQEVSYAQAQQLFVQEKVETFQVDDTVLTMTVRDSSVSSGRLTVRCQVYSAELFWADMGELVEEQYADGIIKEFMAGAKDILPAAIVVGLAGGIIQVLQEGRIIDPILHGLASLLSEAGRLVSLWGMYVIQTLINLIIPSGSAKAALTMPIMAPFSDVIGISRQATVMAYQFGDGFTNMLTPTSAVLMGALGIARIPYDVWVKWFGKILLLLIVLGFVLLIPTITLNLPGF